MVKKYCISLIVVSISLLLLAGCRHIQQKSSNVLVILNSSSPAYCKGKEYIIPYLNHFGLPHSTIDISRKELPEKLERYALLIVAHKQIETDFDRSIKSRILKAVNSGTGLVSFDFHFALQKEYQPVQYTETKELTFSATKHYITAGHKLSDKLPLFGEMALPQISVNIGNVLLTGNKNPLIVALAKGKGRIVVWTSTGWMQTFVLGPVSGLDDCLWKSFVWAARKPFAFRGLPPMITMRVDDVAGQGKIWGKSPLYWVKSANKYGFKPFLALFIYNLRPEAIKELRGYLLNGQATASPHAFGRPPRSEMPGFKRDYFTKNIDSNYYKGYYYYRQGLPLRKNNYDEFIYFDWHKQKPWPNSEAQRGLEAVDQWYEKHQPLPMSKYLVPHWYELGKNVIPHIVDKWGMEFIGIMMNPGLYYSAYVPWLKAGPFRLYEEPGACGFLKELRAQRPVYYADFLKFGNRKLFNCLTEIRDDAGYEWAPDNNVEASIKRGIRQLRRAINSMALPVLFTHETDYIIKIKPENWDKILKGIRNGIEPYQPLFMTMDDALRHVRATKTSRLTNYDYNLQTKQLQVHFKGSADVPTHFYLFSETGKGIQSRLVEVKPFQKDTIVQTKLF